MSDAVNEEDIDAAAHALLDRLKPPCHIGQGTEEPCPAEAVYIIEYFCEHGTTNRIAVCTGHRNAIHNFCNDMRVRKGHHFRITFEELLAANPAT